MSSPSKRDRQELDWLRNAFAASGDLAYEWDLRTDAVVWSGRAAAVFGCDDPAGIRTATDLERLIHPEDRTRRRQARQRHLAEGVAYDCEFRIQIHSGDFTWVHDRGCATLASNGHPVRFTGVMRRVAGRRVAESAMEERVSFDELTGHYNRVRLRDALDHALAYSARYETPGAYVTIGVDGLSQINDAWGFETADSVIVGIGQRLDRELRASDVVGRMDGDRFGIVLLNCDEAELQSSAERVLGSVQRTPIDTPSGAVPVTVSAGGVTFPNAPGQTAHEILRQADIALHEAKQMGRNCFVQYRYSETQRRERRRDMQIARQVQEALRANRLHFAYQPIVGSVDHDVHWYECLLRMMGEDGETVPAATFVTAVERMGVVRSVDLKVLDMAVAELVAHPDLVLGINVSGLTAGDRAWLRLLIALLKGRPEIAHRLIIEITETVALHDIDETARFVAAVRALGCRVALDDFGAGYTSFRHLQALAVDMVKIDGSFVRDLANNLDNQLFVKTLLSLADGFGLETVAECVETADDVAFLAAQGVNYLQGYFFGRPSFARASRKARTLRAAANAFSAASA